MAMNVAAESVACVVFVRSKVQTLSHSKDVLTDFCNFPPSRIKNYDVVPH